MREESHLDDMRAAIRGDFERLAERRGSQELMREEVADAAAAIPQDAAEPGAPSPAEPRLEHEVELGEASPEAKPVAAPDDSTTEAAAPRKSWLARVLGQ